MGVFDYDEQDDDSDKEDNNPIKPPVKKMKPVMKPTVILKDPKPNPPTQTVVLTQDDRPVYIYSAEVTIFRMLGVDAWKWKKNDQVVRLSTGLPTDRGRVSTSKFYLSFHLLIVTECDGPQSHPCLWTVEKLQVFPPDSFHKF